MKHASWISLVLVVIAGCTTDGVKLESYEGPPPGQRYDIGEVINRAKELAPGMTSYNVLLRLGSPAMREGDHWIYLPSDPGLLIPQQAMVVKFEGQRYVSHKVQAVVAGERIILE